jgi:hypothetical protein
MEDRPARFPSAHLDDERGHQVPRVRAERREVRARARGVALAGRPRLLGVERDEHDRARGTALLRERPRRLDQHAHTAAVVVRTGRVRCRVVVCSHHHELGTAPVQDAQHVRAGDSGGGERLLADVVEPGRAELRLDVLRGHRRARRAPRMGPERRQRGGVAERCVAVDGECEHGGGDQREHDEASWSGGL